MANSIMNATLLIATRNRANSVRRCLLSLTPPVTGKLEVIIVDNNSDDHTLAMLNALTGELPYKTTVLQEKEIGKIHAIQTGLKHVSTPIILFSDDDVTFSEGWAQACLDCFRETGCDGMGGAIIPVYYSPLPAWMSKEGRYQITAPFMWNPGDKAVNLTEVGHGKPYGANMGFLAEVFEKENLLIPQLGVFGAKRVNGEDVHISTTLINKGYKIMYWPSALVQHHIENPAHYTVRYLTKWHYASGLGNAIREQWSAEGGKLNFPFWLIRQGTAQLLLLVFSLIRLNRQAAIYYLCRLAVSGGSLRVRLAALLK